MKVYCILLFFIISGFLFIYSVSANKTYPLIGKLIVIDPGHGFLDPGTNYGNILEKDINLDISKYLKKELELHGASILMTRNGDYDLSSPNATFRKKSDFNNRIKLINESNADLYISIHLNYLNDSKYSGPQVFYNADTIKIAKTIQNVMNKELTGDRDIKEIPNETYMYKKLIVKGLLIECGFLSNAIEREKLNSMEYQKKVANSIAKGLLVYFT